MYVVVKTVENNGIKYFTMLASNGTYVDDDITKVIIFSTAALATKQRDVLASLNPDDTFIVKEIVLEDVE